ncbi:hypothetical protein PPSIR1_16490 [Plesiocystis pacifica SIR-1]|uniref:Uncharacterized protein n=1 Tax=Plesiocystis pacifica SIR-1 TaxID=391625 RepID=A6G353_9BACT|nr:hypothetical protein [Plesiocystis pacifica]EDM79678.1 hypothetical protein PPSIR1_16490 [Plesiocystis pacifica SIR-1]
MRYVCSQCHTQFDGAALSSGADEDGGEHSGHGEGLACPNCKAEAGLEVVVEGVAPAMRYFGTVIGIALVGVVGTILALVG